MIYLRRAQAILFLILVMALTACKEDNTQQAKAFVNSAQGYLSKQEYQPAIIQFNNALRIEPNNLAALNGLAMAFEYEQDWHNLQAVLLRTIELYPNQTQAKLQLSRIYLAKGQNTEAQELITALLARTPNDYMVWVVQAKIHLAQGDEASALSAFDQAMTLEPANKESIITLAQMYTVKNEPAQALTILNTALETNSAEPSFYIYKAKILSEMGDTQQAMQTINSAIQQDPTNIGYHKILATLYIKNNQPDKAVAQLRNFVNQQPTEQAILELVYLEQSLKGTGPAFATLKHYTNEHPELAQLRLHSAALLMKAGRLNEARDELIGFQKQVDNQTLLLKAKNQQAIIDLALKNVDSVEQLTSDILKLDPANLTATLTKAKLELLKGDPEMAIRQLRTALNKHGDIAEIHFLLGKSHRVKGETPVAQMHYQKSLNLSGFKPEYVIDSAQFFVSLEKLSPAEDLLLKANKLHPKSTSVLEMLAQVRLLEKDWSQAKATIMQLQTLTPNSGKPDLMMGYAFAGNNEFKLAAVSFKQALDKDGNRLPAVKGYTQALANIGQFDEAIEFIDNIIQERPERPELPLLKLQLLADSNKLQEANTLANTLISEFNQNPIAYYGVADYYLKIGAENKAIKVLKNGIANSKNTLELRLRLAQLYEARNEIPSAIAQYQAIVKNYGYTPLANNNLAALLMAKGENTQMAEIKALIEPLENTKVPEFLDTVGWYYYKLGQPNKALTSIEESYQKLQHNPEVNYHLGMVYKALGNDSQARKHLEFSTSLPESENLFFYEDAVAALSQL